MPTRNTRLSGCKLLISVKELFHYLNIVLPELAVVGEQKPIHLIDEDEGWTWFLRACEYGGHALDRIPTPPPRTEAQSRGKSYGWSGSRSNWQ